MFCQPLQEQRWKLDPTMRPCYSIISLFSHKILFTIVLHSIQMYTHEISEGCSHILLKFDSRNKYIGRSTVLYWKIDDRNV